MDTVVVSNSLDVPLTPPIFPDPTLPPPPTEDPPPPEEPPTVYCVCDYQYGDAPFGSNGCAIATSEAMCDAATCGVRYMHATGPWVYTERDCRESPTPDYYPPPPQNPLGCGCPVGEDEELVLDGCSPDDNGDGVPDIGREECNYNECWVRHKWAEGAPQVRSCHWNEPLPPIEDAELPDFLVCACPAGDREDRLWDNCIKAATFLWCDDATCAVPSEDGSPFVIPCEVFSLEEPEPPPIE